MSGFRRLVEMSDRICREELGNYYVVSESRMNNMLQVLEEGSTDFQRLRAEVERLEEELNTAKFINCERCVDKTARRCVEIAKNSCLVPPDGGSPSVEEVAQAEYVAELIRKEFAIAKAEGGEMATNMNMASESEKWVVHIIGPDDVIESHDELTALRLANNLNKSMVKVTTERHSHDPVILAVAKNAAVEEV